MNNRPDSANADTLFHQYFKQRVEYMAGFYKNRTEENENLAGQAFRAGAFLMSISTLVAAMGTLRPENPYITLITAIIPAIVAFIGAFGELYNWQGDAAIYRDALLGIEEAKLMVPLMDRATADEIKVVYPKFVSRIEDVIGQEHSRWGSIPSETLVKSYQDDVDFLSKYVSVLGDATDPETLKMVEEFSEDFAHADTSSEEDISSDDESDEI